MECGAMIFKIFTTNEAGQTIYARIDDDGLCSLTCTEDYPEFKAWIAEGNTPLPADSE
jgi:hypothetical protein